MYDPVFVVFQNSFNRSGKRTSYFSLSHKAQERNRLLIVEKNNKIFFLENIRCLMNVVRWERDRCIKRDNNCKTVEAVFPRFTIRHNYNGERNFVTSGNTEYVLVLKGIEYPIKTGISSNT